MLPLPRVTPGSLGFRFMQWYGLNAHHPGQWRVHAVLRQVLKVKVDADLPAERQGLHWILNPSDYPQEDLFWLGESDRWDLLHARRFLRPGAVVFDVGANFGYYALMLAAALRGECEVHAFEPSASTHARLVKHVALNGMECVHPHRLALSDVPGTASMNSRQGNSGASFLEMGGGEVAVTTLDEFVEGRGLRRLDFMKIDVEGFEERVLRGGERTLRRLRPIVLLEVQPTTFERTGSSVQRVVDLLTGAGYQLWRAQKRRLVPLEIVDRPGYLVNAFAVPAEAEMQAQGVGVSARG